MIYFIIIILFILLHVLIYRFFKINFLNNFIIFFFFFLLLYFFFNNLSELNFLFLINCILILILYKLLLLGIFNISPSIFIIYYSLKVKSIKKLKRKFYAENFTKNRFIININSNLIKIKKNKYYITSKGSKTLFFYSLLNKFFKINT